MKYGYISKMLDHIDRDNDNNVISNLREANYSQNNANRSKVKNSSSKYIGVYKPKGRKKWRAVVSIEGKMVCLGSFNTEEEAAQVRDKKAKKLHGEFVNLNFE